MHMSREMKLTELFHEKISAMFVYASEGEENTTEAFEVKQL